MIEVIPFAESGVIGFRLNGKIDEEGFQQTVTEVHEALENNQKIRIYAEVEKLGGMSLETFFENLKAKIEIFGELEKFEREAVVSDKSWVETLVKISDKLFPGVDVKHFSFDEKDDALAWIKN